MFSQINPLDNTDVQNIKGCEIFGDTIHFQIIDETGKPVLKKVKKTQFVLTQIEQFQITINANI
jgi:hypothetical protein